MLKKITGIVQNALPIIVMIGLIPLVQNDYILTAIYLIGIILLLLLRRERHDLTALIAGFVVMTLSEYVFISTGVESFTRKSLFGSMPLWLPVLWAYGFVVIKRSLTILEH